MDLNALITGICNGVGFCLRFDNEEEKAISAIVFGSKYETIGIHMNYFSIDMLSLSRVSKYLVADYNFCMSWWFDRPQIP